MDSLPSSLDQAAIVVVEYRHRTRDYELVGSDSIDGVAWRCQCMQGFFPSLPLHFLTTSLMVVHKSFERNQLQLQWPNAKTQLNVSQHVVQVGNAVENTWKPSSQCILGCKVAGDQRNPMPTDATPLLKMQIIDSFLPLINVSARTIPFSPVRVR